MVDDEKRTWLFAVQWLQSPRVDDLHKFWIVGNCDKSDYRIAQVKMSQNFVTLFGIWALMCAQNTIKYSANWSSSVGKLVESKGTLYMVVRFATHWIWNATMDSKLVSIEGTKRIGRWGKDEGRITTAIEADCAMELTCK